VHMCAHVRKGAPVLCLSKMCLCVQSFQFNNPELWQSGQGCAHVREDAPVLHLLKLCLCVQSFRFADPELRQA